MQWAGVPSERVCDYCKAERDGRTERTLCSRSSGSSVLLFFLLVSIPVAATTTAGAGVAAAATVLY